MKYKKRTLAVPLLFLSVLSLSGCSDSMEEAIKETKRIDPWAYIQDNSLSEEPAILNFASSASQLAITIGVIGIVGSILYIALRLLFTSNPSKKQEIKQETYLKGLIGIMIFSIPFWLGVCRLLGGMLV